MPEYRPDAFEGFERWIDLNMRYQRRARLRWLVSAFGQEAHFPIRVAAQEQALTATSAPGLHRLQFGEH